MSLPLPLPRSPIEVPLAEEKWLDIAADCAAALRTTVQADDATGELPEAQLRAIAATGLDTAFLPVEHGGGGLSYATLGRVVRMFAAAHPAAATVWLMHIGAAHALVTQSPSKAAAFFACRLQAGARFANALSEAAGGNHFLSSQQDAQDRDGGWSFTGQKIFVSGAQLADHVFLSARIDGGPAFFGVDIDESVSLPPLDATMGMRATRSRTMVFRETPLDHGRRCSAPPTGYANLITVGFAFISIGIAESALQALLDSATTPRIPDGPPPERPGWLSGETGAAWIELRAATLLAEQTAWLADRRDPQAVMVATEAKALANTVALRTAALALKGGGGRAYLEKSSIQRIFRDAQAGALMAYSAPFSHDLIGSALLAGDYISHKKEP